MLTGFGGLSCDIRSDANGMIHHLAHHPDEVVPRIIESPAQIFGIAGKRDKVDAMSFNKIFESYRRGKFDGVPARHQPQ